MSNNSIQKAWEYFLKQTKKVYVEERVKIETFEEYLSHRYRDNCYYYSGYAIMGLKPDDYLVRGEITLKDDWPWQNGGYRHGWVEFVFEGEEYVFDSMFKHPVTKQEYYDYYKPQISYKKSQKQILDEFLNERCAMKIQEDFWQFKYLAMNEDAENLSYEEIVNIDRSSGCVPSILMLSRVEINKFNREITRFIAYNIPSC